MPDSFHFTDPDWLWAVLPVVALLWLLRRSAGGANPWQKVVDAGLLPHLMLAADSRPRRGPLTLLAAGWTIAVVALANPVWERLPVPALRGDQARVVVFDLSRSMTAPDLAPSRLQRARFKVIDLVQRSEDGQVGLVAFAGDAFTVAPLSDDSVTLASLLDALDPNLMPVAGSRPDLGLEAAARLLAQAGSQHGEVILVADDAGDARTLDAAAALRAAGHRVSVLAVGTEQGAPLPGMHDRDGKVVVAKLDRDALERVAAAGGGEFALLSADDSDLDRLLDDAPPVLDASLRDSGIEAEAWRVTGPWIALLLLPIGLLAFRRGWLLVLAVVTLPALVTPGPAMALGWADLWQRSDQQAATAAATGDYASAERLADDPARKGSARFRQGDYAGAVETFGNAEGPDALYNRANALAHLGQLEQAIEAYDQALAVAPDMEDAAFNRNLVEQALKQRQQQQRQQQQADASGEQQGEQGQSGQGQSGPAGQSGAQGQQSDSQSGESGQSQQGTSETANAGQASGEQSEQGEQTADPSGEPGEQRDREQGGGEAPQQARSGEQEGGQPGDDGEAMAEAEQTGEQAPRAADSGASAGEGRDRDAEPGFADAGQKPGPEQSEDLESSVGERIDSAQEARRGHAERGEVGREQASRPEQDGDDVSGQQVAENSPDDPAATEQRLAMESWLRRIPDDAGGLLRNKFRYQYQRRGAGRQAGGAYPW